MDMFWTKCEYVLPTEEDADPFENVLCLDSEGDVDVVHWTVVVNCGQKGGSIVGWMKTGMTKPSWPRWFLEEFKNGRDS